MATEKAVSELEQARADYKRIEFRKAAVNELTGKSPAVGFSAKGTIKAGLDRMDYKAGCADPDFLAAVEKVAARVDLDDDERQAEYRRLLAETRANIAAMANDTEAIYTEARVELARQADPFSGERKAEQTLSNALSEMQLCGGPPQTAAACLDAAEAAAVGYDLGALQLWNRNLERFLEQAPARDRLDGQNYERTRAVRDKLARAVAKQRGFSQTKAADRLDGLNEWFSGIEQAISIARMRASNSGAAGLNYALRDRTPKERQLSDARVALRKAEAM